MNVRHKTNNRWLWKLLIPALAAVTVAVIGKYNFPFLKGNKIEETKSQMIIAGIVVDEVTNANITLAEITLAGRNEQCSTDQSGNFKIVLKDSLSEVRIRVHKANYMPYDKTFNLPNDNIFIQLKKSYDH